MRFPIRDLLRREFRQVMLAGIAVLALAAFLGLGELVDSGAIRRFDDGLLLALRTPENLAQPRGPAWLLESMRDITALGGGTVMTLTTIVVIGALALKGERRLLWLVLATVAGGGLLDAAAKFLYARARPDLVPHLAPAHAGSFPSGHSLMAAAVYLSFAALLARLESSTRVQTYILSVALALAALIGVSRVYLGVHYPTDVLAGWLLGIGWAAFCWVAGRSLRVKPESPADTPT